MYTNFNCKGIEVTEVNSKKSIPRSHVVRIIDGDGELKKIAGRIPEKTGIVVQKNLYPNLDKIRISKKN